jgi:hypothetical protein
MCPRVYRQVAKGKEDRCSVRHMPGYLQKYGTGQPLAYEVYDLSPPDVTVHSTYSVTEYAWGPVRRIEDIEGYVSVKPTELEFQQLCKVIDICVMALTDAFFGGRERWMDYVMDHVVYHDDAKFRAHVAHVALSANCRDLGPGKKYKLSFHACHGPPSRLYYLWDQFLRSVCGSPDTVAGHKASIYDIYHIYLHGSCLRFIVRMCLDGCQPA